MKARLSKKIIAIAAVGILAGCVSSDELKTTNQRIDELEKRLEAVEHKPSQTPPSSMGGGGLSSLRARRKPREQLGAEEQPQTNGQSEVEREQRGEDREIKRREIERERIERREIEREQREIEREEQRRQLAQIQREFSRARSRLLPETEASQPQEANQPQEIKLREFVKEYVGVEFGDSVSNYTSAVARLSVSNIQRYDVPMKKHFDYLDKASVTFKSGRLYGVRLSTIYDEKYSVVSITNQVRKTVEKIEQMFSGRFERSRSLLGKEEYMNVGTLRICSVIEGRRHDVRVTDILLVKKIAEEEEAAESERERIQDSKGETLPLLD